MTNSKPVWITSSFSGTGGDCVQWADLGGGIIGVRDSKLGDDSPVLRFNRNEARAFIQGVNAGEFDDLT